MKCGLFWSIFFALEWTGFYRLLNSICWTRPKYVRIPYFMKRGKNRYLNRTLKILKSQNVDYNMKISISISNEHDIDLSLIPVAVQKSTRTKSKQRKKTNVSLPFPFMFLMRSDVQNCAPIFSIYCGKKIFIFIY